MTAEKHLAFNATLFFQFLFKIKNINSDVINATLRDIELKVAKVEKMRGIHYDQTLRFVITLFSRL